MFDGESGAGKTLLEAFVRLVDRTVATVPIDLEALFLTGSADEARQGEELKERRLGVQPAAFGLIGIKGDMFTVRREGGKLRGRRIARPDLADQQWMVAQVADCLRPRLDLIPDIARWNRDFVAAARIAGMQ